MAAKLQDLLGDEAGGCPSWAFNKVIPLTLVVAEAGSF